MYQGSFISCTHSGEDVLLGCAANDLQRGFCIDVDAPDPIELLVAKALCERGLHGIDIEPVRHRSGRVVVAALPDEPTPRSNGATGSPQGTT